MKKINVKRGKRFQSTLPARGATNTNPIFNTRYTNFNPRSPRGERRSGLDVIKVSVLISIHAPREGSDRQIHYQGRMYQEFQSTLPARGATAGSGSGGDFVIFQSTLPARGATPPCLPPRSRFRLFQSTLPARGATHTIPSRISHNRFQSTLPARGATDLYERDILSRHNFNPRSPRGERLPTDVTTAVIALFQSTLPARGATRRTTPIIIISRFQSTLPARGAT